MKYTIKLTNGSTLHYKDGKWYKDGKYFTPYALEHYKFYDSDKKMWMQLDPDGTTKPYTPYINSLNMLMRKIAKLRKNNVSSQRFYPSLNIITLRTKGRMNLADVPINMLDSIAINTGRSRTNIKNNLGLIGKEDTFGGYSKALGSPINYEFKYNPDFLTSNWAYFNSPYTDYLAALERRIALEVHKGKDPDLARINAEKDAEYAYKHNNIKTKTKQFHDNVMADAFARYADNPDKYNPALKNYSLMVTNIGNEVWSDPLIQKYWNERGKLWYIKGLNEK